MFIHPSSLFMNCGGLFLLSMNNKKNDFVLSSTTTVANNSFIYSSQSLFTPSCKGLIRSYLTTYFVKALDRDNTYKIYTQA